MEHINKIGLKRSDIDGVFFDIDDTFSTEGKILPQAYSALWSLKNAGLKLVPVTGRPAGWCDHFARMWPVDAIVGENGAFYFLFDENKGKLKKIYMKDLKERESDQKKIDIIREEILGSVSGSGIASDQNYREADLAIDFCEDVPHIGWDKVREICDIFTKHNATCKVSSIHVNGWFGTYSKLEMVKRLARDMWKINLDEKKERFLYLGDSPNDEPMFDYFPYSIGVRNVLDFPGQISAMPGFVTTSRGGIGFAEAVTVILSL